MENKTTYWLAQSLAAYSGPARSVGPATGLLQRPALAADRYDLFGLAGHGRRPARRHRRFRASGHALRIQVSVGAADRSAAAAASTRQAARLGHHDPVRADRRHAGLGMCDPKHHLMTMGALALLVAFLSASQDIVIDAWRVEIFPLELQGAGAGEDSDRLSHRHAGFRRGRVVDRRLMRLVCGLCGDGGAVAVGVARFSLWPRTSRRTSSRQGTTPERGCIASPLALESGCPALSRTSCAGRSGS